MSGFEGMTAEDRFALVALLDEMRVYFHIEDLTLSNFQSWFRRNHSELTEYAMTLREELSDADGSSLEELTDRTYDSRGLGERTKSQRLGKV